MVFPLLSLFIGACTPSPSQLPERHANDDAHASEEQAAKLASFFDEVWQRRLASDSVRRTYMGLGDDHGSWGDLSDAGREARVEQAERDRAEMREHFDPVTLPADARLSYRLFEAEVQQMVDERPWLRHTLPVNSIRAEHLWLASILMGVQPLSKPEQVDDWLARLAALPEELERSTRELEERAQRGVLPPKSQWKPGIAGGQRLLQGAPFAGEEPSPLLGAFVGKLDAMEGLADDVRDEHVRRARTLLTEEVGPALTAYLATLADLAERSPEEGGAWRLPDGDNYYRHQLKHFTNTDASAEEIHAIGLEEVHRVQGELAEIQASLGVKGDLQDFFAHLRSHPSLTLPNDDAGREAYLTKARDTIEQVQAKLDAVVTASPQAPLVVRRVEAYREHATAKAFYERGTVDGSRPGVLYINLADMASSPTYQLPALAYHEGIPGHHLQLGLAQELDDLPAFRRNLEVTAWSEGWGLYAERLPKELGLYEDPYDDAGRLALELWRASRLVVDTGLHHKRWSRSQARDWLRQNTPNPEADIDRAVDRYLAWPGQATAYTMGMLEILRLRKHAEATLGSAFSAPRFHDAILRDGPMPMHILADQVQAWLDQEQQRNLEPRSGD